MMNTYAWNDMINAVTQAAEKNPGKVCGIDREYGEIRYSVRVEPILRRKRSSDNDPVKDAYDNGYRDGKLDARSALSSYEAGHKDGYKLGMKDGVSVERGGFAK